MSVDTIIDRQYAIANDEAAPIELPKQRIATGAASTL